MSWEVRHRIDALSVASAAFVAANLLHTADHVRQGLGGLTWELLAAGSGLSALAVGTLVLTLRHDARAPLVASGLGLAGAIGIAASHLAPYWGVLSDPYWTIRVDALSWAVMLTEIAAALVLYLVGLATL